MYASHGRGRGAPPSIAVIGMKRILLSVPHMGGAEQAYVQQAFTSNWLSTVGPNITAFEQEFKPHRPARRGA